MLPAQPSYERLQAGRAEDASKPSFRKGKTRTWAGVFSGPCAVAVVGVGLTAREGSCTGRLRYQRYRDEVAAALSSVA